MFKGRPREPRPPALPPETRTVGQLVAESLQLYRRRFWPSLALGLPIAIIDTTIPRVRPSRPADLRVHGRRAPDHASPTSAGARSSAGIRPGRRDFLVAFALGVLIFIPFPLLAIGLILPAAAWLALVGLAVPAVLVEHLGLEGGDSPRPPAREGRLRPRARLDRHARDRVLPDAARAPGRAARREPGRRAHAPAFAGRRRASRRSCSSAPGCSTSTRRRG